jgi:hypothetical protein
MLSLLVLSLLNVACATAGSTAFSYFERSSVFHNGYFDRATCALDAVRAVNATAPAAGEWMPWSHNSICRIAAAGENSYGEMQDEKNYCLYSSTSFGGRRGISIITTPDRAATLAQRTSFSSYPRRVPLKPNHDPKNAPFHTGEIPGKGIGVVATRHIQQGDVLMVNSPAMLVEHNAIDAFGDEFPDLFLVPAVANLPKDHRDAYLNLSWHQDATDLGSRIQQIINTNGFDIDIDDGEDGIFFGIFTESESSSHLAVPDLGLSIPLFCFLTALDSRRHANQKCPVSRMNHDCRPNTDYIFDSETLTQSIRATRDIAPGEELTLTYIK